MKIVVLFHEIIKSDIFDKIFYMTKRIFGVFIALGVIVFFSCKKMEESKIYPKNDCTSFNSIEILTPKTVYNIGETIVLTPSIANMPNVLYTWINNEGQSTISPNGFGAANCNRTHEGMYYLVCSDNNCGVITDSVYITVINKADTPTCNTIRDSISYSSYTNSNYVTSRYLDTTKLKLTLSAKSKIDSTHPTFNVRFHNRWTTKEPQDGLYYTTKDSNIAAKIDTMVYKNVVDRHQVFIWSVVDKTMLTSTDGDAVYISHDNNKKLVVTFCNVRLSGKDTMGNLKQTNAIGTIGQ